VPCVLLLARSRAASESWSCPALLALWGLDAAVCGAWAIDRARVREAKESIGLVGVLDEPDLGLTSLRGEYESAASIKQQLGSRVGSSALLRGPG
jgi:hypothetical protein